MVRDALTIGPTRGPDLITPHTRPPADEDADHVLVRTVLCLDGSVEIELICEPLFDYGRTTAEWKVLDSDNHIADATGDGLTVRLCSDIPMGVEGDWSRGRHQLKQGQQAFCSLSWAEELDSPASVDEANERLAATTPFLAQMARRCPPS